MNKNYANYTRSLVTFIEILAWNIPFFFIFFKQQFDLLDVSLGCSSLFQLSFFALSLRSEKFRKLVIKNEGEESDFKKSLVIPLIIVSLFFLLILTLNLFGGGIGQYFMHTVYGDCVDRDRVLIGTVC